MYIIIKAYKALLSLGGFVGFGIGGILFSFIVFPIMKVVIKDKNKLRVKSKLCVHYAFKLLFNYLNFTGVISYKIKGYDNFKDDKSCLIVANHPCLIDVVAIISLYKNATCIVKEALFNNLFCKHVLRGVGYIPNSHSPELMLKQCEESIDRGDVLIIFPEGTRTTDGQPMVLQRGAARIAYLLKVPIRALRIDVKPLFLTKLKPWYDMPIESVDFTIEDRGMISITPILEAGFKAPIAARRLTQKIGESIDFSYKPG